MRMKPTVDTDEIFRYFHETLERLSTDHFNRLCRETGSEDETKKGLLIPQ